MPRTFGDTMIHISHLDAVVRSDRPVYACEEADLVPNERERQIGRMIAEQLVDDGATIQIGANKTPVK